MKFAVCPDCLTIACPSKATPQRVTTCQCKHVALTYTGNDNELAISGPGLLLAFDDATLRAAINRNNELPAFDRTNLSAFVIRRTSSTVLDLDKPAPPKRNITVMKGGKQ